MKPHDRRVVCVMEGGFLTPPDEPGFWVVARRLDEGKEFAPSGRNPLGDGLYIALLEVRPATMRERISWSRVMKTVVGDFRCEQKLIDGGPRFVALL